MNVEHHDPRLTPARTDLAAAHLEGRVAAAKFVSGARWRVARGRASLHERADAGSMRESELLFGEIFTVYEDRDGWCWGQAENDSYVGYLQTALLDGEVIADAHIIALATPLLPVPNVKASCADMLPLNAVVQVQARNDGFARLATGGHIYERHLAPLSEKAADWVAVAERFVGVPYVWGGKTAAGLDCSGLIQTALAAAGVRTQRDTDIMERSLGTPIGSHDLKRGDIVFWNGHMGVMRDATHLLHANAFHMEVASEPLSEAIARIEKIAGPVTSVKRV